MTLNYITPRKLNDSRRRQETAMTASTN